MDLYLPTPEVAAIQFKQKREFAYQEAGTNIVWATNSYTRLKLYGELSKLGKIVRYMDTDSIVYSIEEMNDHPLGDFIDELL